MAESSLARQLKKLAVPQTTILIQDKIRKSFLFDHRDAAGLDREVVFAFGTTGLQKLCTINPMFSKFEADLFSLSYKDFQRSVQSTNVNKKLDTKISEFLRMLSPYLLIREAHEALEWLIYRFHIHLYNVDDLIASSLPHYNTSTFVRVVQLLDLDEKNRWVWLKPIQKTGIHLEYSAVLNRFLTDAGFRKFVCDIAPNVLNVYKGHESIALPIVSFSMSTIYNALQKCKLIEDTLIIFLFPYIFKGLLSDLTKYTLASYMIISKIMSSVKLTHEIVEEILIRIFKTLQNDLLEEACKILVLAFQYQSIKVLPKQVHCIILSNGECTKILFTLLNDYKSSCLIKSISKKTVSLLYNVQIHSKVKSVKLCKFFKKFLNSVLLDEKCVLFIFNTTIKRFSKYSRIKKTKNKLRSLKKITRYIFKNLEHKYPNYFDKAYKRFLEEKSVPKKSSLSSLISSSVCSIKYEIIPDVKTSLALGLYHANPEIRQTSVTYLFDLISKKGFADKKFIENSLYDCLFDKHPNVVLEILSFSNIVLEIIGKPKMLSVFENIFTKQISLKSDWYAVHMKCLDIITKFYAENIHDVLEIILNFIFPVNKDTIEGFLHLLNSNLKNNLLLELEVLKSNFNSKDDITNEKYFHINCMVVTCVKKFINEMSEESRIAYASFLSSKIVSLKSYSFMVFYIYVMQFTLVTSSDKNNSLLLINDLLQILKSYFSQSSTIQEKFEILSEECVIKKCIYSLNKKKFPAFLVYNAFYKIITEIDLNIQHKSWPCLEDGYGKSYQIFSNLFNFCILYINSSDKELLQEYFSAMLCFLVSYQLKSIQIMYWFLSTKWLINSENFLIQYTSVNMAMALCNGQNKMDWLFDNSMIFFCILKVIGNVSSQLRHMGLTLLSNCLKSAKGCTYPLKFLGDEIFVKSEEIKIDYKYCFECIGNWLRIAAKHMDTKKTILKTNEDKELKNKISVLNQILDLLKEETVPCSMKYFLLCCLQNTDNVIILSSCISVLYNHIMLFKKLKDNEDTFKVIKLIIKKFTPKTAVCLSDNSEEAKALLYCLNCVVDRQNDRDATVQLLALDILSEEFFSCISSVAVQQKILENLLTIYVTSPVDINTKVEKVLRELCSYSYLFIKHIQDKELTVSKSTTLREAKKSKVQDSSNSLNTFESGTWKKITVFLELMQGESNLLNIEILIPELFNLLHRSLDYDSQAPVEYIKQLILSAIHTCCKQLPVNAQQQLERDFRVELIIHCIRSSTNSKTHHQALLLLNLAATMFPDYVLKNVMSIFVFMGSSLVRQDDSYSFQVISQTIETIVPSLLEASNQQTETDGYQVVASVIRVFVDSLLDIPGHRQLPLFTKLITTLNPSKYLWIPLGQICDQYATAFHDITTDDSNNWKISPTLEFAVNLHKQFSPDIQIDTCINLVNFLLMLPDTKKQLESNPEKYKKIKEPFNVVNHSDKQLQIYKHNVLSYMKIWLSSQAFLIQVSELSVKQQNYLEEKYELLLEAVLGFLQDRLHNKKSTREDLQLNNQVQLLYDLVHAINSLLPCSLFIRVMRRLLKSKEKEIQARSVELLITKLEQREFLYVESHKSLLKLRKPLLKLVNISSEEKDNKNAIIQQTALYALHLLCKLIGSEYPTKFYKVLNVSVTILSKCDIPELTVNALLCLAQLCHCLNVDILPHLNMFMPVILNILQDKKMLSMHECLILGIITALHSIIENLGIFLSSYMEDIIINTCVHSVNYSELGKKAVLEKLISLQSKLANEIPLRVLFTAVESSYSKLLKKNAYTIVPLMKILTDNLDSSKYEDILSCATQLQNFYISSLDFRNCNQVLSLETISFIESSIISSLQTFVMKLSVTRFRSFFQKIYQWTMVSNEDQEQKQRIFTFYKLTSEFSKSLKSLFSAMSKYFFTHISSVLDSSNISKCKVHYFESDRKLSHELLINTLSTLNYCFMYSEEQLLDKENFDLLMHPLVDQLENLDDEIMYQELIQNHLNSCIAYFMISVSDSALWKALNYQILLKTRHDSPKVRFGALQVLLEVVNKMGDNYLVLLPESIPFLAELMEDESSEVEKECQTVIIEMEKILGEPIRKYF